ncbi:MAG: bacillithiol system redox-active protein YtxJ [Bacteroidetes bacterium]|nr:MAG: bacillithiol system redox-active protein YtxJ [Bacteroidota bacterium]
MGLFGRKNKLNWIDLNQEEQLRELFEKKGNALIFKHSTRCGISSMALSRFESEFQEKEELPIYMLDLLNHRSLSNLVAELSGVRHESPQVLVLHHKELVYQASHGMINAGEINDLQL